MQKEMIISASGHETMVAILEEDLVTEVFVERERHRGVVGNIYKGRVSKVLPGMQCAFIDIGLERDGFLYVSDVVNTIEEFDRLDAGEDDEHEEAAGNGKPGDRGRGRERAPQFSWQNITAKVEDYYLFVARRAASHGPLPAHVDPRIIGEPISISQFRAAR